MKLHIAFLLSLFLCALETANHRLWLKDDSHMELDEPQPNSRALLQTEERGVNGARMVGQENRACSRVTLGAELTALEGASLTSLTTRTTFECCQACQGINTCNVWTHNRENGLCLLYNVIRANFRRSSESELDLGEIPGQNVLTETAEGPAAQTARTTVLFTSEIGDFAPIPSCRIIRGVTYPDGDVLAEGNGRSDSFCCELCRSSANCNSWYHNRRSNLCILNRNTPAPVSRAALRFVGGTIAN
eukprot:g8886.t1